MNNLCYHISTSTKGLKIALMAKHFIVAWNVCCFECLKHAQAYLGLDMYIKKPTVELKTIVLITLKNWHTVCLKWHNFLWISTIH